MGIKEKIKNLPCAPGIYIFKDAKGTIIYIGKSTSLKKRVQSYFTRPLDTKTRILVSKISDIEYQLTPSESQAQLQEASLIKEKQPQYNIGLKDDKSFPWLRITDEKFPLVSIYRRKSAKLGDTALYFGPYTNVKLLRQALKMIRRIFGFRSCRILPKQPCLYYRLKLCQAPCAGKINPAEYREIINQIKLFLKSKYAQLLRRMSQQMHKLSKEKRYEEAAAIRDRINALSAIRQSRFQFTPLDNVRADRQIYLTGFSSSEELQDLKSLLKLSKLPVRIEAFDISNISGKEATGSMVSFYRGLPDKNNYRRFRIKTVQEIDDYDMIREIVRRRYSRVRRENLPLPDLVLIDGGKGHLSVANEELKKLGLDIHLASIAKDRENIYSEGNAYPLRLKEGSPALNLIRRIRDEAHRFAIKYHHLLHRKKVIGK